jgi:hypothetical protein
MGDGNLLWVDVADLRAVRINCTTCNKSKLLVDLGTATPIKQQCGGDWSAASRRNDSKVLAQALVTAIQLWKQQPKPPFQLQFELSTTSSASV